MPDEIPRAATMHIGELAERTGYSLRTLRHYDEIGLLQPSGRTDGGFRLYTEDDLQRLLVIRQMKPLGYSLAETQQAMAVMDAIAAEDCSSEDSEDLSILLKEARERRRQLQLQLEMADEFIAKLTAYARASRARKSRAR